MRTQPKQPLMHLLWPAQRAGDALIALAQHRNLAAIAGHTLPAPSGDLDRWLRWAANQLQVEVEPASLRHGMVGQWLQRSGPALVRVPEDRLLVILGAGWRILRVLAPDGGVHRVTTAAVSEMLCAPLEAPHRPAIERLLEDTHMSPERRKQAAVAILQEKLRESLLPGGWTVRTSMGSGVWRIIQQARLIPQFAVILLLHLVVYLAYIVSWQVAGQAALEGNTSVAWWIGWAVLFLLMPPMRIARYRQMATFSIEAGALLKKRLLLGALKLEPDEVRHQGIGQLLGRVNESQMLEAMTLNNGLYGLLGVVELVMGFTILASGAGGLPHALILVAWVALIAGGAWLYSKHRQNWTDTRREMTHDLVERMVGHRTRLAQEPPDQWHTEEDEVLRQYMRHSVKNDRIQTILTVLLLRGWLILGLAGLIPAFISGQATIESLAIGLGGVIFVAQALDWKFIPSFMGLIDSVVIWRQVAPIFHAAARREAPGTRFEAEAPASDQPLLVADDVAFRYDAGSVQTLRSVQLQVNVGDRILLEGPSGGGKSTLAALLIGLRDPDSGRLVIGSSDKATLGAEEWRHRAIAAPQFHENHVISETFLFNLLMGRQWPPTFADTQEAEAICKELGLQDLLERMPSGMLQWVGETGWQLSHGERSRLFIARALLQDADFIVLDESFAALDPENLQRALACVHKRAKTLLVIAHP